MLGLGETPGRGRGPPRADARRRRRHRDDRPVPAALAREPAGRRVRASGGFRALPRERRGPRIPPRLRRARSCAPRTTPRRRSSPPEPPPGTRPDRSDRVAVMARRWRTLAAGAVSGLLFALAFPPFGWVVLLPLALIPWLVALVSRGEPGAGARLRSRLRPRVLVPLDSVDRLRRHASTAARAASWGSSASACLAAILAQWPALRGLGHGRRRSARDARARLAAFPRALDGGGALRTVVRLQGLSLEPDRATRSTVTRSGSSRRRSGESYGVGAAVVAVSALLAAAAVARAASVPPRSPPRSSWRSACSERCGSRAPTPAGRERSRSRCSSPT